MVEPETTPSVLILGGYGVFGSRLARLLADDERVSLVIAGRSVEAASAFCATLDSKAPASPCRFDRDGDVAAQLRVVKPDLLVDASGPFQIYGDDPYRVVRAAIALRIDYLDLADGADFVTGIGSLDEQARAAGVFALSGTSTCPALTAAVVRRLSNGLARLDSVTGGIAPSPHARVGVNVLRAIASYAGRKVSLRRDGGQETAFGLTETVRYTIAPPGRLPLENRLFSLVDVPDLRLLPRLWPQLRNVWMGMGPTPAYLHRIFIMLARLVRMRLLPDIARLAPAMHGVLDRLRFGPHRGGMFVELAGVDAAGERVVRSWHLVAEGEDGPFIPSMAAAAIIRNCLQGRRPEPGARDASRDIELADYEALFAPRAIHTGIREDRPADGAKPLYRRLLGDAFDQLPEPIRRMHDIGQGLEAEGMADIERGRGLLSRLVAFVLRLPPEGRSVPLTVRFEMESAGEIWRRNFAGKVFSSTQRAGAGRADRLLRESFGPIAIDMALLTGNDRLTLVPRRWSLFGIPMPLALGPRAKAYESVKDDRFNLNVGIALPLAGPLIGYRGWLVPKPQQQSSGRGA